MKISLVIPVFNEELAIPIFYEEINKLEELKRYSLEIIFINDGSKDKTESIINNLSKIDNRVIALNFTRNFGKEPALFAGIKYATGDAVIPIDVDLQDPVNVIPKLINTWIDDKVDVVLAKRIDRQTDSFLKRTSAGLFYKLHNKISSPKIEENVGDFRLLSKATVDNIKELNEYNVFMKGIYAYVGGTYAIVEYTRDVRSIGQTKFNAWKLWNLALEGITSFSTVPLRIFTYLGVFIATSSFFLALYQIFSYFIKGNSVRGYTSIIVLLLCLNGLLFIAIGLLGEYIGRIYLETKQRPKFFIKKK